MFLLQIKHDESFKEATTCRKDVVIKKKCQKCNCKFMHDTSMIKFIWWFKENVVD